ncbi:hypothetical protein RRG08_005309 [Elysia crispata]|uniref:Uncharacterized protein n=1 Tax=Elysia crispata TaxID=231223 RepID=A0AAE0YZZ0_9GAST|nr:hypothetical protein RRG08_005309 [Elysia crispata]
MVSCDPRQILKRMNSYPPNVDRSEVHWDFQQGHLSIGLDRLACCAIYLIGFLNSDARSPSYFPASSVNNPYQEVVAWIPTERPELEGAEGSLEELRPSKRRNPPVGQLILKSTKQYYTVSVPITPLHPCFPLLIIFSSFHASCFSGGVVSIWPPSDNQAPGSRRGLCKKSVNYSLGHPLSPLALGFLAAGNQDCFANRECVRAELDGFSHC